MPVDNEKEKKETLGSDATVIAIELALCEQRHIVLRPDVLYVFRKMPDCAECARIAATYESH